MDIGIGEGTIRRTRLLPRGMRILGRAILAFLLIVTAMPMLSLVPTVSAAAFAVNDPGDAGDFTCDATCTLRDAIDDANATAEADTITFAPAITAITLTSRLDIEQALTIQGPGSGSLTITTAHGNDYGIFVDSDDGDVTVTLSGFTLDHDKDTYCCVTGIYVEDESTLTASGVVVQDYNNEGIDMDEVGALTVTNSTVRNNGGGGIFSCGGSVTVTDSLIEDNGDQGIDTDCGSSTLIVRDTTVRGNGDGGDEGGGIEASGVVLIIDSTIADNAGYTGGLALLGAVATINSTIITGNSASYAGGGIASIASVLQVSNSTISGNSANQFGGGIIQAYGGTLQLTNSTVTANTAGGIGGGLFIATNTGFIGPFPFSDTTVTLRFATIAANSAGIDGGGIAALNLISFGGLVSAQAGDAALAAQEGVSLNLLGTIVAGNVDSETTSQTKADCYGGPFVSLGSNLLGTGSDCPAGGAGDVAFNGDIATVLDPALADNGGPTPTHALVADSPALGIAADAACASSDGANGRDQRGVARPQGIRCDSGAYESDLPPACDSPFGDVAQTDPACVAIVTLAQQGVIQGFTNGNFGPDDPVQRAQMAAFIVRAFQWQGLPTGPRSFTDFGELVDELRDASLILANLCADQSNDATCVARGYGDGRFGPTDQVSYAQVISFITRAFALNENYGWTPRPNGALPYTGLPSVHATDIRTYTFYAGAISNAPATPAGWDAPAPREWVAIVLYQALQSTP